MGNNLQKEFDVGEQVASGGPDYLWKIVNGTKKSTQQEVSIFIFDKKAFADKYSKALLEKACEVLRREIAQLSRLRHPYVLQVLQTVEETKTELIVVTEQIFSSVGNLLRVHTNLSKVPERVSTYAFEPLEVQCGLLHVAEALAFCHGDAKIVHCNVAPENVYVSKKGDWKIAGFGFCVGVNHAAGGEEAIFVDFGGKGPANGTLTPNLGYLAPEYVFEKRVDPRTDIFAMGCLAYHLSCSTAPIDAKGNVARYKDKVTNFDVSMEGIPLGFQPTLREMMSPRVEARPDTRTFMSGPYFAEILVRTVRYLDKMIEKENISKAQFLRGLTQVLARFTPKMAKQRVIPPLLNELKNEMIVPFVLPNLFILVKDYKPKEFETAILPYLIPVFTMNEPVQILLCLIQNMEVLMRITPPEKVREVVLPLVFRAFEHPNIDVQREIITRAPAFAPIVEYQVMKSTLLPRIHDMCLNTTDAVIRVSTVETFTALTPNLDKWAVTEVLVPLCAAVVQKDRSAPLLMALLALYKAIADFVKVEAMSVLVLPPLVRLATEPALSRAQFKIFMSDIRDLISKMESWRMVQIEEAERLAAVSAPTPAGEHMNDFQRFQSEVDRGAGGKPSPPALHTPTTGGILQPTLVIAPPLAPMVAPIAGGGTATSMSSGAVTQAPSASTPALAPAPAPFSDSWASFSAAVNSAPMNLDAFGSIASSTATAAAAAPNYGAIGLGSGFGNAPSPVTSSGGFSPAVAPSNPVSGFGSVPVQGSPNVAPANNASVGGFGSISAPPRTATTGAAGVDMAAFSLPPPTRSGSISGGMNAAPAPAPSTTGSTGFGTVGYPPMQSTVGGTGSGMGGASGSGFASFGGPPVGGAGSSGFGQPPAGAGFANFGAPVSGSTAGGGFASFGSATSAGSFGTAPTAGYGGATVGGGFGAGTSQSTPNYAAFGSVGGPMGAAAPARAGFANFGAPAAGGAPNYAALSGGFAGFDAPPPSSGSQGGFGQARPGNPPSLL